MIAFFAWAVSSAPPARNRFLLDGGPRGNGDCGRLCFDFSLVSSTASAAGTPFELLASGVEVCLERVHEMEELRIEGSGGYSVGDIHS